MNSFFSILFSKAKLCFILFACTVFMMGTCTNTDPTTVSPTARLEIFGTEKSGTLIDITSDGKTVPKLSPGYHQINPVDIVIRATGIQPDKNIAKVTVTLGALDSRCIQYLGNTNTTGDTPSQPPKPLEFTVNAPGGGVGILPFKYQLKEYAKKFTCQSHLTTFEVLMDVTVRVYNISGKMTELPPVKLKMVYKASDLV